MITSDDRRARSERRAMTPPMMRRVFLREADVMLVLARLAVRVASPARIFAWADRPPRRIRRFAVDEIGWVSWAVENVGARPWMNALCLPRALAAHAMLRRRLAHGRSLSGIQSRAHARRGRCSLPALVRGNELIGAEFSLTPRR